MSDTTVTQKPPITALSEIQRGRCEALRVAREVLGATAKQVFGTQSKEVEAVDLVSVASWIVTGEDPWAHIKDTL